MKGVFIIPTGIDCEIGGDNGDANPSAKLIASVCDELIVHPNVVNASDINEMTDNMLYVEGSLLDLFLEGKRCLERSRGNKILVVTNPPLRNEVVNAVSAGRVTIGADIEILVLKKPIRMEGKIVDKAATGDIDYGSFFVDIEDYKFDALAIHTEIFVKKDVILNYLSKGGINPWGGVEAKLSKVISNRLCVPVAHAPCESETMRDYNEIVHPTIAPELISMTYLHSVLKGLHKAPRIGRFNDHKCITNKDIDFLISPLCYSTPHIYSERNGIRIIYVLANKTSFMKGVTEGFIERKSSNCYIVSNYLEAVGLIKLLENGMTIESVTRPIKETKIHRGK